MVWNIVKVINVDVDSFMDFLNLLECTRSNSLKPMQRMKTIEKTQFLCPENNFGQSSSP